MRKVTHTPTETLIEYSDPYGCKADCQGEAIEALPPMPLKYFVREVKALAALGLPLEPLLSQFTISDAGAHLIKR